MKRNETSVDSRFRNCYRPDGRRRNDNNMRIRESLQKHGIRQWELAEALGMREESLSRLLRHELAESEQEKICIIIRGMAK